MDGIIIQQDVVYKTDPKGNGNGFVRDKENNHSEAKRRHSYIQHDQGNGQGSSVFRK